MLPEQRQNGRLRVDRLTAQSLTHNIAKGASESDNQAHRRRTTPIYGKSLGFYSKWPRNIVDISQYMRHDTRLLWIRTATPGPDYVGVFESLRPFVIQVAHSASETTQASVPQRTAAASPKRLMSFEAIKAPAR